MNLEKSDSISQQNITWDSKLTRRDFLRFVGLNAVLMCLTGCKKFSEQIVPYVKTPEGLVAGKPLYFATALSISGSGRGILVRSDMGRPTKIEGNPEHPDSLGATDAITQAALYHLYDPDRSYAISHGGIPSTWIEFKSAMQMRLTELKKRQGHGLRFISRPIISPTLDALRQQILKNYPSAQWHTYSPLIRDLARQAYLNVYGQDLYPRFNIQNAKIILSVECDFLTQGPGSIAYARAFSEGRQLTSPQSDLIRLYSVESTPTLTGASADHRIVLHPSKLNIFLKSILDVIETGAPSVSISKNEQTLADTIAADLKAGYGKSLVVCGLEQGVDTHMLVCRLNEKLGAVGRTLDYLPPID
jgi:hypothetical protein